MIKAIALDDENPALTILTRYCEQTESIVLEKTFTKPSAALNHIVESPPDLIFLDINMPNITGVDFYKNLAQKLPVIFTTAYSEYAVEGFNLNAIDYLLKPFTLDRFQQAIEKAKLHLSALAAQEAPPQYLWIRADYTLYKIPQSDILFIEGLDDYVKIHIENAKTIVARMTMKALLEKLPNTAFIRVHKCFIVALKRIQAVRHKTIYLNGVEIPIGGSYEEGLMSFLQEK